VLLQSYSINCQVNNVMVLLCTLTNQISITTFLSHDNQIFYNCILHRWYRMPLIHSVLCLCNYNFTHTTHTATFSPRVRSREEEEKEKNSSWFCGSRNGLPSGIRRQWRAPQPSFSKYSSVGRREPEGRGHPPWSHRAWDGRTWCVSVRKLNMLWNYLPSFAARP